MAKLLDIVRKGSVDRSVTIRIIDSADGTPETGVVFNTAGIDLWYRRQGGLRVAITEATLAALDAAHSDGGFLHISDGEYRLDLPDAAFAAGANQVDVGGTVTGMVVIGGRVRLVDVDLEDPVRGGLTALPNANAGANGGVATIDANLRVSANVTAMAANVMTAAATAADLTAELQSGLATAAALDAVDNFIDTEVADILAAVVPGIADLAATLADLSSRLPATLNGGRIRANAEVVGDKTGYSLAGAIRFVRNTALANFTFLMVDAGDNPATGLAVTAERSLDGAALAPCANAVAEISNGLYRINLAAGDLDGDVVTLRFTAAGARDRVITIITQADV